VASDAELSVALEMGSRTPPHWECKILEYRHEMRHVSSSRRVARWKKGVYAGPEKTPPAEERESWTQEVLAVVHET